VFRRCASGESVKEERKIMKLREGKAFFDAFNWLLARATQKANNGLLNPEMIEKLFRNAS
jgi:hypothetical protein